MSLDKDRLGNAMADRVITIMGANAPGAGDETDLRILMKALADEIVKEVTANAIVNTATTSAGATLVGPPGGPLPIAGLAGTGVGTVT